MRGARLYVNSRRGGRAPVYRIRDGEHPVLALQRTVGNRAATGLITRVLAREEEDEHSPAELKAKYLDAIRTVAGSAVEAENLLSDCGRIQLILLDREWMLKLLSPLERRASWLREQHDLSANGALRAALKEKEKAHGFKEAELLPLNVLPGKLFVAMITLGFAPPKDPGAGLSHGEWTHRLQWNALLEDYDSGCRMCWRHRPIDVYKFLGDPRLQGTFQKGSQSIQRGLFSYLMDVPGKSIVEKKTGVERTAKPPTEGFRRPDDVTWILRHDKAARKALPTIAQAVSSRFDKRLEETAEATTAGKSFGSQYQAKKTADGDYRAVAHKDLFVSGPLDDADRRALELAAAPG